ncbi:hypothetical protein FOZ60_006065 [Perkinsus olseni]|uniref:Uncharacterized protein n=2 Tax=Perkinsus olseni TaxID=32597 RepID=A0A7J6NPM4_PEROL|nr:hypothetical protein FOZ60_006065 [Perkinsus olseni]KAF4718781.1 hypothetical protein FOZ62_031728 [Perkinsus olseni]
MNPLAYVFLFTSSLISVTAIHSSRAKTDTPSSEGSVEMSDPGVESTTEIYAASNTCTSDGANGSLVMYSLRGGDYSVRYVLRGDGTGSSVQYHWMERGPREGTAELEYWHEDKVSLSGYEVEGPIEDIKRKYSKFNPFDHVEDIVVQKFKAGMNKSRCLELVNHIETKPAAGYEEWGRGWLKQFVEDNREEAMEKLRKEGKKVYYDD